MASGRSGGKRRRPGLGVWLAYGAAGGACLAFAAWLFGGAYLKHRDQALNLAREWKIEGAPCESVTRREFAQRGLRLRRGTIYEDARFYREFGHMSCSGLRYGGGWGLTLYPVCQFTGPRSLRVSTRKGDWYYAVPPGQPATVAVLKGTPRCVLAANFTMKRLMGRAGQ